MDIQLNQFKSQAKRMLGYQVNQQYSENFVNKFGPYLSLMINNCGDPSDDVALPNTKKDELNLLDKYKQILGADITTWGYIGAGGSEGVLWGLYNGKLNLNNPVVLYSSDAHYSVKKAINLLGLDSTVIPVNRGTGSMDLSELTKIVYHLYNRDIIVLATHGTTFYGGYDDIKSINDVLARILSLENNYYIHVDGAFGAPYKAYIEDYKPFIYAQSLSFSLHKLYGLPIPASVILCKEHCRKVGGELIEYVSSHDSTICGSRVGLAPLMANYRLHEYDWHTVCQQMRDYSENLYHIMRYKKLSNYLNLYPNSNCLVFDKPSDNLIK
ncbi:MAG: pyridoxal-dependent decarboxylase, partial [Nitrososphaeraceae archaeon]|nr:pyridoxal-dependent decarboxylase [Nitrososphaeraceae archaeon]